VAITTYDELQAAAARWLVRADLSVSIPDFIALFEAHANRKLRVKQMEARDEAQVVDEDGAPTEYGTYPTDYLEAKTFSMTDGTSTWWLESKPDEVIDEQWTRTGRPRFYAEVGGEFRFFPTPDQVYTGQLTYWAQIPALSASNATNWLLAIAPDAYLFGTLLEAAPMLRDADQLAIWQVRRDQALASVQSTTKNKAGRLKTEVSHLNRRRHYFDITRGV